MHARPRTSGRTNSTCTATTVLATWEYNCGNAGQQFWMTHNAFQYKRDNAIKLRGKPRKSAYIAGQHLPALEPRQGRKPSDQDQRPPNHVRDRLQQMAPGHLRPLQGLRIRRRPPTTYSFRPALPGGTSAAKNGMDVSQDRQRTAREDPLGYFDGDKRCDVFAVHGQQWVISSPVAGPWKPLGTYGVPPTTNSPSATSCPATRPMLFDAPPTGQWYIVSPGNGGWSALGSSSFPLSQLRFGDFTGDGVTDVLALQGGPLVDLPQCRRTLAAAQSHTLHTPRRRAHRRRERQRHRRGRREAQGRATSAS